MQPRITRGDVETNLQTVQRLVNEGRGDLLVLPEYVLTGSLALDPQADVREWALRSAEAKDRLEIPAGRHVLINTLAERVGKVHNCCELLPGGETYCKLYPDQMELDSGIAPGSEQKVFELLGKRFKAVICFDLPHMAGIPTDSLDFALFVYHFTEANFARVIQEVRGVSRTRRIRVLASSLVSDQNNGNSSFIDGDTVVSLPDAEGILEVDLG